MAIDFASKRRFKNFQVRKVREALPEYFTSEFPKLVSFIEKYYDFLDSADATHSFGDDLKQIFATKDIGEMPNELLNSYVNELAANLETGGNFTDTRFALRRLAVPSVKYFKVLPCLVTGNSFPIFFGVKLFPLIISSFYYFICTTITCFRYI